MDNKTKRVPKDPNVVDINDADEMEYWCREFNCTPEELRAAVEAVGHSAQEVRKYLREKRKRRAQELESPGGL